MLWDLIISDMWFTSWLVRRLRPLGALSRRLSRLRVMGVSDDIVVTDLVSLLMGLFREQAFVREVCYALTSKT